MANPSDFSFAAIMLAGSGLALGFALDYKRKQRLLDDTPISKTLGVFIGEVELVGVCERKDPYTSYLANERCVFYSWEVTEHWTRGVGKTRRSGTDVVASGGEAAGFYLKDEAGFIWIDPEGAELEPSLIFCDNVTPSDSLYYDKGPREAVEGTDSRRTFTEKAFTVGMTIFVRGRASERTDVVAAQIAKDDKADMFIISCRKEQAISDGMSAWSGFWHFAGATAAFISALVMFAGCVPVGQVAGGFMAMLFDKKHPTEMFYKGLVGVGPFVLQSILVGVGLYLLARLIGWTWMCFNSVVGLRNRVAQAYSLIDVQLKRRADIIDRLVACVKGFREHEVAVQRLVTEARARMGDGPVKALAPGLQAVVESYPEIRALASFDLLRKNLIETEDRIALARGYHNNIATFYNTRLERVPDSYLAGLVKMKPEPLFEAEGFTYHPAAVAF